MIGYNQKAVHQLSWSFVSSLESNKALRKLHHGPPMTLSDKQPRYVQVDPTWGHTQGGSHVWASPKCLFTQRTEVQVGVTILVQLTS